MNTLPGREAKTNLTLSLLIFLESSHNGAGQDGGDFGGAFFRIELVRRRNCDG